MSQAVEDIACSSCADAADRGKDLTKKFENKIFFKNHVKMESASDT